jgi:hypothetical protein
MKRYDRVKQILDEAVNGQNIGAHGPFWRTLTLEQFKLKRVFGIPLLVVGSGAQSNLVHALRGESPFGADLGVPGATYPRMPVGFPPIAEERVAFIEQWITDGCPDDDVSEDA